MKRFMMFSVSILCLSIAIQCSYPFTSEASSGVQMGWFNDEARTVLGHGCWTGPPFYWACGDYDVWRIEGMFGWGEAYFWIYTGEEEISAIEFLYNWSCQQTLPDGCHEGSVYAGPNVVGGQNFHLWYGFSEGCYGSAVLSGCHKGWILMYAMSWQRTDSWSVDVYDCYATLCDGNDTIVQATMFNSTSTSCGYTQDIVSPEEWNGELTINNDESSWGAIKSLYNE